MTDTRRVVALRVASRVLLVLLVSSALFCSPSRPRTKASHKTEEARLPLDPADDLQTFYQSARESLLMEPLVSRNQALPYTLLPRSFLARGFRHEDAFQNNPDDIHFVLGLLELSSVFFELKDEVYRETRFQHRCDREEFRGIQQRFIASSYVELGTDVNTVSWPDTEEPRELHSVPAGLRANPVFQWILSRMIHVHPRFGQQEKFRVLTALYWLDRLDSKNVEPPPSETPLKRRISSFCRGIHGGRHSATVTCRIGYDNERYLGGRNGKFGALHIYPHQNPSGDGNFDHDEYGEDSLYQVRLSSSWPCMSLAEAGVSRHAYWGFEGESKIEGEAYRQVILLVSDDKIDECGAG